MYVDFLIVGAGLAGASTGYYLKQRAGATTPGTEPSVVVLEKEDVPGAHSSGRNASQIRRQVDDPDIAEMVRRGADVLATGELADFRRTGSILIGLGDSDVAERFPLASGRGLWCPDDGIVDVASLLSSFLRGLDVRYGAEVTGWDDAPPSAAGPSAEVGSRLRVHTNQGDIDTGILINAAGAWAGVLGDIPMTPTNRHLFFTPPIDAVGADWPYVWDVSRGLYFRPESGGLLMCACDETPAAPGCYDEDSSVADRLGELVRTLHPGLGEISVMRSWVGQRTFAPDRRFVIGFDHRDPRIFHVAGLGGYGVSTAPAVGTMAASLLLGESKSTSTNPFDPKRLI